VGWYGGHILETGDQIEAWEDVFGRYFLQSRFLDKKSILDIGPGRCWFTRQAPDRILAVDSEPDIVERYSNEGLNIVLGTVEDLPIEDRSYDGLFCCWLLEHLNDPHRAMVEAHRVLVDGGYALFLVPSVNQLRRGFFDDYTHVRPFTHQSLHQLARSGGFSKIAISYLFWTRGVRRIIPRFGPDFAVASLHFLDSTGRRLGLVNRNNLILEVWK
jgi:ubiquinone/menaquinone biosynthesis C-methylase UbiE